MQEEWKDIVGFEGFYQVSNFGNVRSFWLFGGHKYRKRKEPKMLKPTKTTTGYLKVALSKNGLVRNVKIHRLVATAFLSNEFEKEDVNHKDFDKTNNNVENLEWCTRTENMKHSSIHNRLGSVKNKETKKKIIELYLNNTPSKKIMNELNVTPTCFYRVLRVNGITYRHKNTKYAVDRKQLHLDFNSNLRTKEIAIKHNLPYGYVNGLRKSFRKREKE